MDADASVMDRALNRAILGADISSSFEEYLAIVDRFYDEDVEVASDSPPKEIKGKAQLLAMLRSFLIPIHVMAEVAGLSVSLRQADIPSDSRGEFHATWELDLVGTTGKQVTVCWSSVRRWRQSRVVCEWHYDHKHIGETLTEMDLNVSPLQPFEDPGKRHYSRQAPN